MNTKYILLFFFLSYFGLNGMGNCDDASTDHELVRCDIAYELNEEPQCMSPEDQSIIVGYQKLLRSFDSYEILMNETEFPLDEQQKKQLNQLRCRTLDELVRFKQSVTFK